LTAFSIIPSFIDSPQGRIFVLHHSPRDPKVHSGVVLVPPFAEEMNKSRRMLTLVAEALARRGFHVMLPDFYGTGDSEGDFADASWCGWLEQLNCSISSMKCDYGVNCYSLLTVRSGALLAAQYLQQSYPKVEKLAMWQPVVDGGVYLTQFLRLRLASSMLSGSEEKESIQSLKQRLTDGEVVEVAGYGLASAVTDGLVAASLKNIAPAFLPATCWIDVVANDGQMPPLMNRKLVQSWAEAGVTLQHQCCVGEPFWGSVEIVEIPDMVAKTISFFCRDNIGDT